jgi:hypothetical protein
VNVNILGGKKALVDPPCRVQGKTCERRGIPPPARNRSPPGPGRRGQSLWRFYGKPRQCCVQDYAPPLHAYNRSGCLSACSLSSF